MQKMMDNNPSADDNGGGTFILVKSSSSSKKDKQVGGTKKTKPEFTASVCAHFLHSPSFNPFACAEALFGCLTTMDSATVVCVLPPEEGEKPSGLSLLSKDDAFPCSEVTFGKHFKVFDQV